MLRKARQSFLLFSLLAILMKAVFTANRLRGFYHRTRYPAGPASSVTSADFNGDGIPDLAVANQGAREPLSILLGKGDGTFQPALTVRRRRHCLCPCRRRLKQRWVS